MQGLKIASPAKLNIIPNTILPIQKNCHATTTKMRKIIYIPIEPQQTDDYGAFDQEQDELTEEEQEAEDENPIEP